MEAILSNLKSALSQLNEKIAKVDEKSKAIDLRNVEVDKIEVLQKEKVVELAKREKSVSHIECIDEEIKKAQTLIKESKIGSDSLDEKEKNFAAKVAKFAQEREQLLREVASGKRKNQKQADALIAEQKEFDARVKAYKAVQAAV